MIRSFVLDDRLLSLVPKEVQTNPSLNLFSADSMTLLVGPNGSGKTWALSQLASLLQVAPSADEVGDAVTQARPATLQGEVEGLDSTCAVYYTAIPFGVDLPDESPRFVRILPKAARAKTPPDLEAARHVLERFGLRVTMTLKLAVVLTRTLQTLLKTLEQARSPITNAWLDPIRERLADLDQRERIANEERIEKEIAYPDYWGSAAANSLKETRKAIEDEFKVLLRANIGSDFRLKVRAFAVALKKHRNTKDYFLQLLKEIGFSVRNEPGQKQHKAHEAFAEALARLKKLAGIVKNPTLSKASHAIDTAQWEALEAMDLEDLATLTMANLSSGGEALLQQFSSLKRAIDTLPHTATSLMLLIDEGDAYLHLEWQQQYVDFFDSMVQALWRDRFACIQVVMTTHSPVLMSDFPRDHIHRIIRPSDAGKKASIDSTPIVSFAAPLDLVIHHTGAAGTLGSFAARIIREIAADIERGVPVAEYKLDMIDDRVIATHLRRKQAELSSRQPNSER